MERVTLYWQPGCTSCLRTKEFLKASGVDFISVNVHDDAEGMEALHRMGPRTVPVVARGDRFVFAQVLDDVATFLGIAHNSNRLSPAALVSRLDGVLSAAERYLRQLPDDRLETLLPRRKRTYRELGYHIFRIPAAFLEVTEGIAFSAASANLLPPAEIRTVADIVGYGVGVHRGLSTWWVGTDDRECRREVETYYGLKPLHLVLERTAWHSAQHTRQLMMVLGLLDIEPDRPLAAADLAGLPLPENVWDPAE
ncbi:MAG: glutaredoxin [Proteobacteria bacterium]|nr:glutaredoxin [Pseudomonadota bacterium]MBI3497496.1 glutaredoxin [Pseudomonadota bacterium]